MSAAEEERVERSEALLSALHMMLKYDVITIYLMYRSHDEHRNRRQLHA